MLAPSEMASYTTDVSVAKVNRSFSKVLVASIMAGIFVAMAYFVYLIMATENGTTTSVTSLNKFLGSVIFTIGIIAVIVAGADLFTGNCLIMFGVIDKKVKFSKYIVNLLIVLLGNLIGGTFIAALIYFSNAQSPILEQYVNEIAQMKVNLTFTEGVIRGIICNLLVALGVYMSYASKTISGKVLAAGIPVTAFVITGFEHVVANMYILPLSLMQGGINSIWAILFNNFIPVAIGNFIGGGLILPLAYYYLYLKKEKE